MLLELAMYGHGLERSAIEGRVRDIVKIDNIQFEFITGKDLYTWQRTEIFGWLL